MNFELPIKVFDFFSGCGGSCKGFHDARMEIVFALDDDPDARETFESNFSGVEFCPEDITDVPTNAHALQRIGSAGKCPVDGLANS